MGVQHFMAEGLEGRVLLAADAVLHWNEVLLDAIRADKTAPPLAARDIAMVQCAVYDAVNAVKGGGKFSGYLVNTRAPKGTSADAAVAQAAHDVLVQVFPAQAGTFDAELGSSLARVRNSKAKAKGVMVGQDCASAMMGAREGDGANQTVSYTVGSGVGVWQPTPPGFSGNPVLPQWPGVTPLVLPSGSMFRPAGPPALDSAAYTAAFEEVEALGDVDSTARTADQTQVAEFWADGAGTATPPGHWNLIAQDISVQKHLNMQKAARLFALLDMAEADAGIAAWDAKYAFNYWRPVTAIRAAETDGNPDTAADPTWTPLLVTPPFPTYVSGHSTFSAAAATVLADFFGRDNVKFTTTDDTLPGAVRTFTSFSQAAAEAGQSRVYGGIHWQFDNQDGLALGKAVGGYVFGHAAGKIARGGERTD